MVERSNELEPWTSELACVHLNLRLKLSYFFYFSHRIPNNWCIFLTNKTKKINKMEKYASFVHKLRKLALNLRMNITKDTSSSVRLSLLVHSRVVHHVSEWTSSFQNYELVQFVQLKDSFSWTSSWTTDPSLECF